MNPLVAHFDKHRNTDSNLVIEVTAKSEQQHSNISNHSAIIKMETRRMTAQNKKDANNPIPVKVSHEIQPQQTVADLGDLGKLPPELRNKIYEIVLAQPAVVKLQSYEARKQRYVGDAEATPSHRVHHQVAPVDHKRNPAHRGQQFVAGKWIEVPSKTALVQVNKALNAETSSILYGFNSFDFTSTSSGSWPRSETTSCGSVPWVFNGHLAVIPCPQAVGRWRP